LIVILGRQPFSFSKNRRKKKKRALKDVVVFGPNRVRGLLRILEV
jgi:hypothetical protein